VSVFLDPQTQTIAIGAAVAVVLLILVALIARGGNAYPYVAAESLLTPAERAFYAVLHKALGRDCVVMAKVRLADLIEVATSVTGKRRYIAFNRISAKHVDFVLCESGTLHIIGVIELDDRSHLAPRRQQRDHFMDSALAAAQIPILRVPAQRSYVAATLRAQIEDAFGADRVSVS
jgi:hypothetical protein